MYHDGVADSLDSEPIENVDEDGDSLPDDWESYYNVTDPFGDPDNDDRTNLQEYLEGTDPTVPDGKGGELDYSNVALDQFYEKGFDTKLFRVTPINNPKYWRLTAFDNYDNGEWHKFDDKMKEYQGTVLPEVTRYQTSTNRTYTIEFFGSFNGYMPTALHTTNIFNLNVDSTYYKYDPNYLPKVLTDKEGGYYIQEEMRSYDFAMIECQCWQGI